MKKFVAESIKPKLCTSASLGLMTCVLLSGCSMPWVKRENESEAMVRNREVRELLTSDKRPRLIGDAAKVTGLAPQRFEAFGVVTALPGTGGDIKPGPQRDYVLKDMRSRDVENPNAFLASNQTAVVKVRANVPAGVRAGDRVDLILEKSIDCQAKDLRNGQLLPTRLLELMSLGGRVRESGLKANAAGYLVTIPPSLNSTKEIDPNLAIILGGGTVAEDQRAYIRLDDSVRHGTVSKKMATAINQRFDISLNGELRGVAEAKSDRSIELLIPPKYQADIGHFTDVVLCVGFTDEGNDLAERIAKCGKRLTDPITARQAAWELEAIGEAGKPPLQQVLNHPNPEIQFYAAYALAYLDDSKAVPVLKKLAETEPAMRALALNGLLLIENIEADEALRSLLQSSEAELCYGALRKLRERRAFDAMAAGQKLGAIGRVTEVASPNKMIAVSLEKEAEIALFGGSIPLAVPDYYEINPRMTMRMDRGLIRLAHFRPDGEDLLATAEPNVRSFLDALAAVQGTYSDAIIFLDNAQQKSWLSTPVNFNPLPAVGRKYDRTKAIEKDVEFDEDLNSEVLNNLDIPQDEASKPQVAWWNPRKYFAP